jgi:hypothetical protein
MKNPASQFLAFCLVTAISFSCSNGERNNNRDIEDGTEDYGIAPDSMRENFPADDTVHNYREGTPMEERSGNMDTLQLPRPIVETIEKDSALRLAMIVEKILRVENGQTFYEVAFYPVDGKEQSVIFDAQGNRKPAQ